MMKMTQLLSMTRKMNKPRTAALLAGAVAALCVAAVPATPHLGFAVVHAQTSATARRTIEGKVHDAKDAPLQGAVVYLKDSRTLAVKSFISNDDGAFHFGQLSQNTDYELYAEYKGKRSKSKTISSFDSKNDFNFTLKIEDGK
jgi:hypothetical protein